MTPTVPRAPLAVSAALVATLALAGTAGASLKPAPPPTGARPAPVARSLYGHADPSTLDEQAEVAAWYTTRWLPATRTPVGATTNAATCSAGGFSPVALRMMDQQLNAVRDLAGLDRVPVIADAVQQRGALLMDANDQLSHTPPSTWKCWTQDGYDAANRSNISMAWPEQNAGSAVTQYMFDTSITSVGHRRWVLYPYTREFRVGQTQKANVLQTIRGPLNWGATAPATTPWPRAGWFPTQLDPGGRWSLTVNDPNASFSSPTVRVVKNGVALASPTVLAPEAGAGNPTLVWDMPAESVREGTYQVTVTGIVHPGQAATSTTYAVKLFTVR